MKTKLLFLFLLASVCGWGQIITINLASAGGSANLGSNNYGGTGNSDRPERTWTQNSVTFGGKAITANPINQPTNGTAANTLIQTQASNGVIYNTTPIPGRILSIQVVTAGTDRPSTVYGGSTRLVNSIAGDYNVTGTSFGTGSGNQTWSTGVADYRYFAIKRGANAAYFSSIIITYEVIPTCTAPTTQATNFTSTVTGQTTATVGWTRGNGNNVLVVARAGGAVNADPTSGTAYSANPAFGTGAEIGAGTGNYVVYNGNGNSVNLTGLTAGTTYHFAVYEYNDMGTCYNTTELTGNLTTLFNPSITITPTSNLNLGTTICQGTRGTGNYMVSGSNLTANVILTPSVNLEISSDNTNWFTNASPLSLSYGTGTLANTTIYVRSLTTQPLGAFTGTISHTSTGVSTVTKNVSGTVVAASSTTNAATAIVNTTATLNGNFSNPGNCFTATEKGFIYARTSDNNNPFNGDVNGTTVFKVPAAGVATGNYNVPVIGLSPSTNYSFRSYITNGTTFIYGEVLTFNTLGVATNLVFNPAPPTTGGVGINLNSFSVRARRADNSLDSEYTGAVTLSKASGPGNINGTLTVNAIGGIATFNNISFDDAGTYTIQAASGSLPSITSGNIVISFISSYTDYFRSRQNGNWTNVNTWQSSQTGLPGTWINATLYPDDEATSVEIRTEDIVNINASGIFITNTKVFGTLRVLTPGANAFTITGDEDIEFEIENGGILDVSSWGYPSYSSDAYGLVKTGGKIIANPGTDDEFFLYDYLDYYGAFIFEDQAIAEWNLSTYPPSSNDLDFEIYNDNVIYPADENAVPIFRISNISSNSAHAYGSNANATTINAVLEINTTIPFNIFNNQNKTFMGGIRGNGSVNIFNNSGVVFIGEDGIVPELGGNVTLILPNINNQFRINNGGIVPTGANFIIQSNNNTENRMFRRVNGTLNINGTLDITNTRLNNNNSGDIIVNNGGKIRTRNTAGLFGAGTAIIDYELSKLVFNAGSTAEYYGTVNQTVSNGLEYSNLEITGTGIKTGAIGNIIVNQITKVNDGAKFHIAESDDDVPPNVLTAKGGINVSSAAGTELVFQNNANLIQNIGVLNTGNITQLRKAIVPSNQYNFWTSPVKNQVLYSLYPGIPAGKVMVYNTATDYFNGLPVSSTSAFGKGYSIKGSNQPAHAPNLTATFIGTPQNESLTSAENLISLSNVGQRFNLIGNPFPSNLDLKKLNDHTSNSGKIESSTFYFWDNTDNTAYNQQGSGYVNLNYANYNASSDVGTAAPRFATGGKKPNGIVKPGQGFIVQAATGTTGIIVENSMRTTEIRQAGDTEDAVYFKNGDNGATDDIYGSRPRNDKFWIEMVNPVGMHVQIAVGYFKQAENTFETYDSKILSESVSDNLYSLSKDAHKLSIQGRQGPFEDTDVIPLGTKFFVNGKYKIQLEETVGIFKAHQNIYLKDKYLNQIHNLSESPYDFEGNAGLYEDRFEIIFKDGDNISDPLLSTTSDNDVKITKKDRQIEITSSKDKILEVEIFNLSGWSVYKNEKVNSNALSIPASLFGKQIVVVKVKTKIGEIVTKKIINK